MGVNLSTFWHFSIVLRTQGRRPILGDAILPLAGFAFCGLIWWNRNLLAKIHCAGVSDPPSPQNVRYGCFEAMRCT
jgi:hypothetical protein